ncbi:hypothetical protein F4703DRAFT_1819632 [Phycomyces blakesleeanus]
MMGNFSEQPTAKYYMYLIKCICKYFFLLLSNSETRLVLKICFVQDCHFKILFLGRHALAIFLPNCFELFVSFYIN